MATETTYTQARARLAALCDEVVSTREPVIIHRRGAADVALIDADELRGLMETAHLLRSPRNAERRVALVACPPVSSLSPEHWWTSPILSGIFFQSGPTEK